MSETFIYRNKEQDKKRLSAYYEMMKKAQSGKKSS